MRYDSGRGVSLISVSRMGRWVSGMPVKSGQALLAEDSHAWGRTSTVQSDITHSAHGFQPHQNDCATSETNRMGTTRHVSLTCRRIFELVWSASLRGAMSSILTIFFVKESFGICIYEDFRTTKDVLPTLLITSLQVALGKLALIHARPADGWTRPSFDIFWLQHSMSTPACFQHSEVTRRFHMLAQMGRFFSYFESLTKSKHDRLGYCCKHMFLFILETCRLAGGHDIDLAMRSTERFRVSHSGFVDFLLPQG